MEKDGVRTAAELIGRRITQARLAIGFRRVREFTQSELAEVLGVTPPTVGRWERGEKKPDSVTIERIADALNADPGWLTYGPARRGCFAGELTSEAMVAIVKQDGPARPARKRKKPGPKAKRSRAYFPPMWFGEDAFATAVPDDIAASA